MAAPDRGRTASRDDEERGRIDPAGLTLQLGLLLLALFAAAVVLGALFRDDALLWSRRFVDRVGGPGILLGLFVPDAFPIPLPQDAFLTFGLLGGLGFWPTVAWGGVGSIAGAVVGFFMGRWCATTRVYTALVERIGTRGHDVVARYGMVGLGLSAVTPIPFGACCWAVGALGMRLAVFVLVVQIRWLRVAGYLWLIEAGFLGATGGGSS